MGTIVPSRAIDPVNSPYQNILINGGFENWSGGINFSNPPQNAVTADKWITDLSVGSPVFTISQETNAANLDQGSSSLKLNVTSVGGATTVRIFQNVSNFLNFRGGKTLTATARIKTTAANVKIAIYDGYSFTESTAHSGSGNFETLTTTLTFASVPNGCAVYAGFLQTTVNVGIVYIDSVMLTVGSSTVAFTPELPAITDLRTADQNLAQNILINGGMDFWQRGISFPMTNGIYTADRWKFARDGGPTGTISREATIIDSVGAYAVKLDITVVGGATYSIFQQTLDNSMNYRGKTLTFSMRVRANSGVQLFINDGVTGATRSASHSGSGAYETLSVTKTLTSSASISVTLNAGFFDTPPSVSTTYFDSAMLVIGSAPVAFVPKDPQIELAQCQRYCQRIGGNITGTELVASGQWWSTTRADFTIRLPVAMYATPTVTVFGVSGWRAYDSAGNGLTVTSLSSGFGSSNQIVGISPGFASGGIAGNGSIIYTTATSSYLTLESEL